MRLLYSPESYRFVEWLLFFVVNIRKWFGVRFDVINITFRLMSEDSLRTEILERCCLFVTHGPKDAAYMFTELTAIDVTAGPAC